MKGIDFRVPVGVRLPVLEVDGETLGQTLIIARYLGKQFRLAGNNAFEEAQCDELLQANESLGQRAGGGIGGTHYDPPSTPYYAQ